ncbi:MAG: DUF5703 family protein [Pseudonocardiales bacterium]
MPPEYEYQPLRLPPGTDRVSAQVQLSVQAEFSGWELATLRLFPDGTRQVTLRRPRGHAPLPRLSS